MNPFEQSSKSKINYYTLKNLALKSYDKYETAPYTKTRVILLNGTEFESVKFYHQFARHCSNNELRREIAEIRRVEQQQQKRISSLKPINELYIYPPKWFPMNPTLDNFKSLFSLMSSTWVPFSRYIFNTVFVTVVTTALHIVVSALAAWLFPIKEELQ